MLPLVIVLATVSLAAAAPNPVSNVLKLDLDPNEAQQYLNNPPYAEPRLAPQTAVLPLVRYDDPRFRSVEAGPTLGHYWRNGEEIRNTEDYNEETPIKVPSVQTETIISVTWSPEKNREVYEASQYHGQDGRGAYAYGYETPESAKVEDRAGSGNLKGSYVYKDGNNELIKVRYWADSQGFHQEDNIPKVELKPAEETEEVRQARLAHEKAWQQARAAALLQPDPYGEYQPSASEQQGTLQRAPGQYLQQGSAVREAKAYSPSYQPAQVYPQPTQRPYEGYEEPEPTGPPRGFFYSYTYPVSKIVLKNSAQPLAANPSQTFDYARS